MQPVISPDTCVMLQTVLCKYVSLLNQYFWSIVLQWGCAYQAWRVQGWLFNVPKHEELSISTLNLPGWWSHNGKRHRGIVLPSSYWPLKTSGTLCTVHYYCEIVLMTHLGQRSRFGDASLGIRRRYTRNVSVQCTAKMVFIPCRTAVPFRAQTTWN